MGKTPRISITSDLLEKLNAEQIRTGVGASKLMRGNRSTMPDGLTSSTVARWKQGTATTAVKAHVDWVLEAYAAYQIPDKTPLLPSRMKITDTMLVEIQGEVERTGLGAVAILRHAPKPLPDGLNHQKIQNWIGGSTKTAKKEYWDFVMKLYSSLGR